jgi:hypothetical protein
LEDETDLPVADLGQAIVIHLTHVLPVQQISATGGHVQRAYDVHQGGFAGARWPHDGQHLARMYLQRDAAQGMHLQVAHAVDLGYVSDVNQSLTVFQCVVLFTLKAPPKN